MKKKKTTFGEYVLAYLLWLVTIAISGLVAMVLREILIEFSALSGWSRYVAHTISQFSTILLGLGVLIIILLTEHLYRTGVQRGKLLIRFCFWAGLLLAIIGFAHLFSGGYRWLNNVVIDPLTPRLAIVELAGAIIMFWWRRILRLRSMQP